MSSLPLFDLFVIALYLFGMIGIGVYFSRKKQSTEQFTKASGHIPGWALGISLYATFLSSNTFLGVPGKAFGGDWNAFVFSLSMPFAAWIAAKYFVPFYRKSGEVSAYTHLERRFGPWARTYAMVCFVLTQLARMGSIFFWHSPNVAGADWHRHEHDHDRQRDLHHYLHHAGGNGGSDMD